MNKGLIALAFGGLAIGMTEFNMMGLLMDIAKDVNISIPKASNLIGLYALGVVVGAPTLVIATANVPPKKVLIYLMLMFFYSMASFPWRQTAGVFTSLGLFLAYLMERFLALVRWSLQNSLSQEEKRKPSLQCLLE